MVVVKENNSIRFNIVIIGDHSIGKSTLLETFITDGERNEIKLDEYIGVVFKIKDNIQVIDKENKEIKIKLALFDFNGGYRFLETIVPSYYKNPNAFIICYSKDNLNSLNNISKYINDINIQYKPEEKSFINNKPTIIIAGLKADLSIEKIQVDTNEALKYCDSLKLPSIHTVSSKENIDIDKLFQITAQQIYDNGSYSMMSTKDDNNNNNSNKCTIN